MEAAGEVRARWETGATDRRGPRRRIYHLTPKGARRLAAARVEWQRFARTIGGILGAPA
jgi:DNA-binding PadR family transcriptional regulator